MSIIDINELLEFAESLKPHEIVHLASSRH
jgi:hypothetical protein